MKTKLDLLLDTVQPGKRELTIDVRGYSEYNIQRVIDVAIARGFNVASDGKYILVRDLREVAEGVGK